jgi:hypothetical protein
MRIILFIILSSLSFVFAAFSVLCGGFSLNRAIAYIFLILFFFFGFILPYLLYKKFFKAQPRERNLFKALVFFVAAYFISIVLINTFGTFLGMEGPILVKGGIIVKILGNLGAAVVSFLVARNFYRRAS